MTFAWPHLLWLLLLPLAFVVRDFTRHRHATVVLPKILEAEAGLSSLVIRPSSSQRGAPTRWRLHLALALAVLGLARPQWGRIEEPVFDQSREILIAIDLSRSMLAEDVKPSRLERAKLLIASLLERLQGERVGLVVFSGTAFLQSPLSADYEVLTEFLPELTPDYLPAGGSDYDALLDTATSAFSTAAGADRYLIILSDGEAETNAWRERLPTLKTKGIRVIGLGVGTAAGAMIPDAKTGFVKDERGAVVMSKLTGATLQQLATETDGVYTDASTWVDLPQLLQATVERGQRGEFKERTDVRLGERFQWFLGPALLLALWSFWREFPVYPRPRPVKLASATAALLLLLLASGLSPLISAHAAVTPTEEDDLAQPLSKLVGQLADRPSIDAKACADLAQATVTYGQRLQSSQQPPPEGVLQDGIAAVDTGRALDPKAADWDQLERDLRALAQKPEPPPQEQSQPNDAQDQKDSSQKDQKESDQNQNKNDPSQSKENSKSEKQSQSDSKDGSQPDKKDPGEPKDGDNKNGEPKNSGADSKPQSAFGDMKPPEQKAEPQPQPAPSQETQQVGGAKEKPEGEPAKRDPALALSMQKLDQVRRDDSPAKLFQLMQQGEPTEKAPPATKGQDW